MRSLISIFDLTVPEIDELIETAKDIIANPEKYAEKCKHKKLATLFYEPSTRTRLSFEAAMLELGGSVLGFSEATSLLMAKKSLSLKMLSPPVLLSERVCLYFLHSRAQRLPLLS